MSDLKFIFRALEISGMWMPESFSSLKIRVFRCSYIFFIGFFSTVANIFEFIYILNCIQEKYNFVQYRDAITFFLANILNLSKFFITNKNRLKIRQIKNFLSSEIFAPNDRKEIQMTEEYKKMLRYVTVKLILIRNDSSLLLYLRIHEYTL